MNDMTINYNGQNYIAKYNKQTGYYEVNLLALETGGICRADIKFTDLFGHVYEDSKVIQILAKEKVKIETNKVFMWIFDYKNFSVKDIVEISDYEIIIDEETNANTIIKVLKKTTAKARDIIAIKKNNEVIYWGIVDNISNKDGKQLYEYNIKYITNMFNEKIVLNKNIEEDEIEEGYYRIKSALDSTKVLDVKNGSMESEANVQIWSNNNTDAQKWKLEKENDGYFTIECIKSNKRLDVLNSNYTDNANVQQCGKNNADAQRWKIEHIEGCYYKVMTKGNSKYCLDVEGGSPSEGTNVQIYTWNDSNAQKFFFEKLEEEIIKEKGIEDFIEKAIRDNFTNSKDALINKEYLEIRVKTHTKLQTSVNNVEEGIYNLSTWMTNCTQLYNINYNLYIENKKLILEIENKSYSKELIDVHAHAISNYSEVFDTDVVSKVEVMTDTNNYYLYLLNDRTTTTDKSNINRAEGKTERVHVSNYEEAEQKALDIIKSNSYNHNITFNMYDKFMKVGTPVAIKTKESLIFDTYISAIKITQSKFIEYTCGNIRINFLDKLSKERRK